MIRIATSPVVSSLVSSIASTAFIVALEVILVVCAIGSLGCAPESTGVFIQRGDVRVELPAPGMRVFSEVLRADGSTETLDVTVDDAGEAHIEHVREPARAPEVHDRDETHTADALPPGRAWDRVRHTLRDLTPNDAGVADRDELDEGIESARDVQSDEAGAQSSAASSSPLQCNDTAFSLLGTRFDDTFEWRFRGSSTPAEISMDAAEVALVKATENILKGRNSCSLSDQISATATYLGRTTKGTQVRSDGGCNAGDGFNVVNFGALPSGVLGVTCTWSTSDGDSLESDVKLNNNFAWTTTPTSTSCDDAFDVESVMTHERGHTFGLGHVSDATHTNLTMSTAINGPCQKTEVTLGKGDVLGLRELY